MKLKVLVFGWLMVAASIEAFTSTHTVPHHYFRDPLRTQHGEIRPVENLMTFSSSLSSSSPGSSTSPFELDVRYSNRLRPSLSPLYQSSRTETLITSSTTRSPAQLLQARGDSTSLTWLSLPTLSTTLFPRHFLRRCSKQAILVAEDVQDACERCTSAVSGVVQNFWWLLPLLSMCLVPLYTVTVFQAFPETPHFWKLVSMDHVLSAWIAPFLASNATYYMAAARLFSTQQQNRNSLATWMLAAGTVSTIFHTVQSLGSYRLAELLCYLDHGVAGTAMLYFWHECGAPSRRTWALGSAGLACLACPGALYPALHSLWHALSAMTAVVWVHDGQSRQQQKQQQQR